MVKHLLSLRSIPWKACPEMNQESDRNWVERDQTSIGAKFQANPPSRNAQNPPKNDDRTDGRTDERTRPILHNSSPPNSAGGEQNFIQQIGRTVHEASLCVLLVL